METLIPDGSQGEEPANSTACGGSGRYTDQRRQPDPDGHDRPHARDCQHGGGSNEAAGDGADHRTAGHSGGGRLSELGLLGLARSQEADVVRRETGSDKFVDRSFSLLMAAENTNNRTR